MRAPRGPRPGPSREALMRRGDGGGARSRDRDRQVVRMASAAAEAAGEPPWVVLPPERRERWRRVALAVEAARGG